MCLFDIFLSGKFNSSHQFRRSHWFFVFWILSQSDDIIEIAIYFTINPMTVYPTSSICPIAILLLNLKGVSVGNEEWLNWTFNDFTGIDKVWPCTDEMMMNNYTWDYYVAVQTKHDFVSWGFSRLVFSGISFTLFSIWSSTGTFVYRYWLASSKFSH